MLSHQAWLHLCRRCRSFFCHPHHSGHQIPHPALLHPLHIFLRNLSAGSSSRLTPSRSSCSGAKVVLLAGNLQARRTHPHGAWSVCAPSVIAHVGHHRPRPWRRRRPRSPHVTFRRFLLSDLLAEVLLTHGLGWHFHPVVSIVVEFGGIFMAGTNIRCMLRLSPDLCLRNAFLLM